MKQRVPDLEKLHADKYYEYVWYLPTLEIYVAASERCMERHDQISQKSIFADVFSNQVMPSMASYSIQTKNRFISFCPSRLDGLSFETVVQHKEEQGILSTETSFGQQTIWTSNELGLRQKLGLMFEENGQLISNDQYQLRIRELFFNLKKPENQFISSDSYNVWMSLENNNDAARTTLKK